MFVCVHSTALGPAAGGTRMKTYAHLRDALADGLRLSSSMTRKNAVAGLPLGGGKAVLSVPEIPNGEARRSLLLRYADVVESRAKELAVEVDGDVVGPDDAIATECDIFSPNATGGVLSAESIPRLRCRIVVGAANNQLAEPEDAERFAEHEILYAPDYVVNAGGIIHLASLEMLGETVEERDARIAAIGETVTEVFRIADAEHISTERAADRIVQQRLAESAR